MRFSQKVCLVFALFLTTAQASQHIVDEEVDGGWTFEESPLYEDEMQGCYDPLEPYNRFMFTINDALDKVLIMPISLIYIHIFPKFLQCGIENFAHNFFSPLRTINFILQGDSEQATKSVFRFIINTIFGFFGTVDVAAKLGLEKKDTSFGDTLKKWGAGPGPYIVLPIFGPTSLRGGISKAMTLPVDPIAEVSLLHYKKNTRKKFYYAIYGADLLAKRSSVLYLMKELEETSDDMYKTVRDSVMSRESF